VQLTVQAPADLPPVGLGADVLLEALGPLLDNARESLPGPGTVSVTAEQVSLSAAECLELWGAAQAGEFVRVDVSDDGPGLPAEVRARLFREPFFTNKPRHRGLGLAIVYGVLHSHRGGFCLLDRPGGGLTARVFLPTALVPAAARPGIPDRTILRGGTPTASAALPR
jgi:signal transduction histidine kinase